MKSYHEHLKTLVGKEPSNHCHRASAIFPVFSDAHTRMELLFLNYWKLKRDIEDLTCQVILRNGKGEILLKKFFYIEEIKAYSIKISNMVSRRMPFVGSVEIEFSSKENMVFPYPGVVVHYQGAHFSTFVHSAQRIFNDSKDKELNARSSVIESGFNIYANETTYPFLTYIQGPISTKQQSLQIAAYNREEKVIGANLNIQSHSFSTTYISLENWKGLKEHLHRDVGCIKVRMEGASIFPRLIVGNCNRKEHSLSVTHTYYDLVQNNEDRDYWVAPHSSFHPATLALPLKPLAYYKTLIYFYPIYSPKPFCIDLEVYDVKGNKISELYNVFQQELTPLFKSIDPASFFSHLNPNESYILRMIAKGSAGDAIPARIKIGYDVGFKNSGFSCNICTNFNPANSSLDQKKKTFKWAPLLPNRIKGSIWCLNDAPKKNYSQNASVKVTFFRDTDSKVKIEHYVIPPHGALEIRADQERDAFLHSETGWCTFESDNPFISTYYFSEHPSKMIGGDHGF